MAQAACTKGVNPIVVTKNWVLGAEDTFGHSRKGSQPCREEWSPLVPEALNLKSKAAISLNSKVYK